MPHTNWFHGPTWKTIQRQNSSTDGTAKTENPRRRIIKSNFCKKT